MFCLDVYGVEIRKREIVHDQMTFLAAHLEEESFVTDDVGMLQFLDVDEILFQKYDVLPIYSKRFCGKKCALLLAITLSDHSMCPLPDFIAYSEVVVEQRIARLVRWTLTDWISQFLVKECFGETCTLFALLLHFWLDLESCLFHDGYCFETGAYAGDFLTTFFGFVGLHLYWRNNNKIIFSLAFYLFINNSWRQDRYRYLAKDL